MSAPKAKTNRITRRESGTVTLGRSATRFTAAGRTGDGDGVGGTGVGLGVLTREGRPIRELTEAPVGIVLGEPTATDETTTGVLKEFSDTTVKEGAAPMNPFFGSGRAVGRDDGSRNSQEREPGSHRDLCDHPFV